MRNLGGLVIVGGGVLLFVIGWRGTQHAVFPGLFATASSNDTSSGSGSAPSTAPSPDPNGPAQSGQGPYVPPGGGYTT